MLLCWSQSGQDLLKLQKHAWYWSNVDASRSVWSAASVKNMDCLIENCVCVVVAAWTQSNCWIYGINLTIQCIGCISFCVVSCYSTIKVLKNDRWNLPSPIYIVFGHRSYKANHNQQREIFVSIYPFRRHMKPLKMQIHT